jgi:fructose-1,6-bisphosphatase
MIIKIQILFYSLLIMSLCIAASANNAPKPMTLSELEWKNRIIIVLLNHAKTDSYKHTLETADENIRERDIVWFIVSAESVLSNEVGLVDQALVNE